MEPPENQVPRGRSLGRYVLYDEFAIGGTATVHFGRLRGQGGFSRTVAIKRLHPPFARDPHFVSLLVEEARLAARVQHPNVVAPLDVVAVDDCELLLVMEYVHGEALSRLLGACARRSIRVAPPVAVGIISGVLYGLQAAHEAVSDAGDPLNIVHRDLSPQNILVGADGAARVLDFGMAKATSRSHATDPGVAKGKLSYMAPEQLRGKEIDSRADLFAAGIVLWEMLTLRRLFRSDDEGQATMKILKSEVPPPSRFNPHVSPELDQVVAGALARQREARYASALDFAAALEEAVAPASAREVGQWVQTTAQESLARRAQLRANVESASMRESGSLQVLSVTAATVPAPEDESVTVRATPGQLRAAAVDGPLRRLAPPPRPEPVIAPPSFQMEEPEALADEMSDEMDDRTETDAYPPEQEIDEDEAEIDRALAVFSPHESLDDVLTNAVPPEPALLQESRRPTPPPGLFETLKMRTWFQVPTRVWGALGMTAFAAALALVLVLPSRSSVPPTRGARTPASARPAAVALPSAAVPLPAAPQVESLTPPPPSAQPPAPPPPVETAQNDESPAPEPARPRLPRQENPVVDLEDDAPAQVQPGLFGKMHASASARRRWRLKNRAAEEGGNGSNCSPPYVLDERGIRRIRPECLAVP